MQLVQSEGEPFPDMSGKSEKGGPWKLKRILRDRPEAYAKMLQYIELGAEPWVCAQALGVHYITFTNWHDRGRTARRSSPYKTFYDDVMKANARCRAVAEIEVRTKSPEAYLRSGPGRFQREINAGAHLPGWTEDTYKPPEVAESYKSSVEEDGDTYLEIDGETLSATIHEMEKLGLIELTDSGRRLLGESSKDSFSGKEEEAIDAPSVVDASADEDQAVSDMPSVVPFPDMPKH